MSDFTASPAVDVALGLAFLFLLLSLICSTVSEIVAGVLGWRSRFLEDGVRSMLSGTEEGQETDALVQDLAGHPIISGKVATPAHGPARGLRGRLSELRARLVHRRAFPSYLNTGTFTLAFLDVIAGPGRGRDGDLLARVGAFAHSLPADHATRRVLLAFLDHAGKDAERLRRSIETWFEYTMDRVSGWYKRRTQVSLCVIATVVTLACNADALQVARALWNDDAVRAAVVAQAQATVREGGSAADVGDDAQGSAQTLSRQVSEVRSLSLPLGWSTDPEDPRWFDSVGGALGKGLGLLTTILAITLGAPFWFDLLGRVSRVRTTGKPERPNAV